MAAEDLELWTLTRGEHGNIGVFFRAPSLPEAVVRERFRALLAAELAAGRDTELREIMLVGSTAEMVDVIGPQADRLAPVLALHVRTSMHPAH